MGRMLAWFDPHPWINCVTLAYNASTQGMETWRWENQSHCCIMSLGPAGPRTLSANEIKQNLQTHTLERGGGLAIRGTKMRKNARSSTGRTASVEDWSRRESRHQAPKRDFNQGNPIENREPIHGWVWCFMIDIGSHLSTWFRCQDSTGSLSHPPVAGEDAGRNVTEPGNRTALI